MKRFLFLFSLFSPCFMWAMNGRTPSGDLRHAIRWGLPALLEDALSRGAVVNEKDLVIAQKNLFILERRKTENESLQGVEVSAEELHLRHVSVEDFHIWERLQGAYTEL